MKIKEITSYLESIAPLSYQESYDNAGLLVGNAMQEINSAVLCIDVTEEIVEEAIKNDSGLIIAHHPLIFSGLKKITGRNLVERIVLKAIKNNIAIYAAHTNIDNIKHGVSYKLAEKLGIKDSSVLAPSYDNLYKLVIYVPVEYAGKVRDAVFNAGAGNIGNYSNCSYNISGEGTFKASDNAKPFTGKKGEIHFEKETRVETIIPGHLKKQAIKAIYESHPYEEPAYDLFLLNNANHNKGLGAVGKIEPAADEMVFLKKIKKVLNAGQIKYTRLLGKPLNSVAVCGGAGSFLLDKAIASGAKMFISADFKYHDFFNADNKIVIVDVGHYETEQFTSELFYDLLTKKFPTFAFYFTKINSNPVNYL